MKNIGKLQKNNVRYSPFASWRRTHIDTLRVILSKVEGSIRHEGRVMIGSFQVKSRLVLASLLVLFTIPVNGVSASNGPILDQECSNRTQNFGVANNTIYQEFIPDLELISKIEIITNRTSGGTGKLQRIRLIRSSQILDEWNPNTQAVGSMQFVVHNPSGIQTSSGEVLKIEAQVGSNYWWVYCEDFGNNPYPPGDSSFSNTDFLFKTYAPQDETAPTGSTVDSVEGQTLQISAIGKRADLNWKIDYTTGSDDTFTRLDVNVMAWNQQLDQPVRQIQRLNRPELTADSVVWDGLTDSGKLALPGTYIFKIQVCDQVLPEDGKPNCENVTSDPFVIHI